MEDRYLNRELSLKLKKMGYDEFSFACYFHPNIEKIKYPHLYGWKKNSTLCMGDEGCTAVAISDAFDWIFRKFGIYVKPEYKSKNELRFVANELDENPLFSRLFSTDLYEDFFEARLNCADRLINYTFELFIDLNCEHKWYTDTNNITYCQNCLKRK